MRRVSLRLGGEVNRTAIESVSPPWCFPEPARYVAARAALKSASLLLARQVFRPAPHQTSLRGALDKGATLLDVETTAMKWPPLCFQAEAWMNPTKNVRVRLCHQVGRDAALVECEARYGAVAMLAGRSSYSKAVLSELAGRALVVSQFRALASDVGPAPQLPEALTVPNFSFRQEAVEAARDALFKVLGSEWIEVDKLIERLDSLNRIDVRLTLTTESMVEIEATFVVPAEFTPVSNITVLHPQSAVSHGVIEVLRLVRNKLNEIRNHELREALHDRVQMIAGRSPKRCDVRLDGSHRHGTHGVELEWDLESCPEDQRRSSISVRKRLESPTFVDAVQVTKQFIAASVDLPQRTAIDDIRFRFDEVCWRRVHDASAWDLFMVLESCTVPDSQPTVVCSLTRDDGSPIASSRASSVPDAVTSAFSRAAGALGQCWDARSLSRDGYVHASVMLGTEGIALNPDVRSLIADTKGIASREIADAVSFLKLLGRFDEPPASDETVQNSSHRPRRQSKKPAALKECEVATLVVLDKLQVVGQTAINYGAARETLPAPGAVRVIKEWLAATCRWGALDVESTDAVQSVYWSGQVNGTQSRLLLARISNSSAVQDHLLLEAFRQAFAEQFVNWVQNLTRPMSSFWTAAIIASARGSAAFALDVPVMDRCEHLRKALLEIGASHRTNILALIEFSTKALDIPSLLGSQYSVTCVRLALDASTLSVDVAFGKRIISGVAPHQPGFPIMSSIFDAIRIGLRSHHFGTAVDLVEMGTALQQRTVAFAADGQRSWLDLLRYLVKAGVGDTCHVLVTRTPDHFTVSLADGKTSVALGISSVSEEAAVLRALSHNFGIAAATGTIKLSKEDVKSSHSLSVMPNTMDDHSGAVAKQHETYHSMLRTAIDVLVANTLVVSLDADPEGEWTFSASWKLPQKDAVQRSDANPISCITSVLEEIIIRLVGTDAKKIFFAASRDGLWWGCDPKTVYDAATLTPRKILFLALGGRIRHVDVAAAAGADPNTVTVDTLYSPFHSLSCQVGVGSDTTRRQAVTLSTINALHRCFRNEYNAVKAMRYYATFLSNPVTVKTLNWAGPPLISVVADADRCQFVGRLVVHTVGGNPSPAEEFTALTPTEAYIAAVETLVERVATSFPELEDLLEDQTASVSVRDVIAGATSAPDATDITLLGLLRLSWEGTSGTKIFHRWVKNGNEDATFELVESLASETVRATFNATEVVDPIASVLQCYVDVVVPKLSRANRDEISQAIATMISCEFSLRGRHLSSQLLDSLLWKVAELRVADVTAALRGSTWEAKVTLHLSQGSTDQVQATISTTNAPQKKECLRRAQIKIIESLGSVTGLCLSDRGPQAVVVDLGVIPAWWRAAVAEVPRFSASVEMRHKRNTDATPRGLLGPMAALIQEVVSREPKSSLQAALTACGILANTMATPKLSVKVRSKGDSRCDVVIEMVAPSAATGEQATLFGLIHASGCGFEFPSSADGPTVGVLRETAEGHFALTPAAGLVSTTSVPLTCALPRLVHALWNKLTDLLRDELDLPDASAYDVVSSVATAMRWNPTAWRCTPGASRSNCFKGPFSVLTRNVFGGEVRCSYGHLSTGAALRSGVALCCPVLPGNANGNGIWVATVDIALPPDVCVSTASCVTFRIAACADDKKSTAIRDSESFALKELYYPAARHFEGGSIAEVNFAKWFPAPLREDVPTVLAPPKPVPKRMEAVVVPELPPLPVVYDFPARLMSGGAKKIIAEPDGVSALQVPRIVKRRPSVP